MTQLPAPHAIDVSGRDARVRLFGGALISELVEALTPCMLRFPSVGPPFGRRPVEFREGRRVCLVCSCCSGALLSFLDSRGRLGQECGPFRVLASVDSRPHLCVCRSAWRLSCFIDCLAVRLVDWPLQPGSLIACCLVRRSLRPLRVGCQFLGLLARTRATRAIAALLMQPLLQLASLCHESVSLCGGHVERLVAPIVGTLESRQCVGHNERAVETLHGLHQLLHLGGSKTGGARLESAFLAVGTWVRELAWSVGTTNLIVGLARVIGGCQ